MLKRRLFFINDSSEAGAGPAADGASTGSTEAGAADDSGKAGEKGGSGEAGNASNADDLPEHWQKELSAARNDAARYRNQLRETEKRLEGAKTAEEFESAVTEYKTQLADLESNLARERVARKHNLPDDLAARLQGATEAEMEADAKTLASYVKPSRPAPISTPGGGLDPNAGGDLDTSPEALSKRYFRRS